MNEITISVKELYQKAKDMMDDGMEFVTLSLFEPDNSAGIPAWVGFVAGSPDLSSGIDYEDIESVEP
ncbi:hypothetical protein KQI82_12570 [Oscillibacter sp. MSJ-2]|uniref:Uncharacterized protein n=1 Tax=Dysosmobacter acutus TaxID=2841504 RepID=A0ABS6FEL5_9FIRM|nr:hypothetical protein [Dysosmobacter acutus]MBU5627744.1 hypothetical protein [Dysosmobacter acutus]